MTDKLNPSPDFPWLSDASRVVDWSVMLINRLKQELGINALRSNTLLPGDNPVRITLTAATTFFVSNAGSDTNNGLTAATPWLTIQHAVNVLTTTYDFGGQSVTIQLADGTYSENVILAYPWVGGNMLIIVGNVGTPANVVINPANGTAFSLGTPGGFSPVSLTLSGMKISAAGGSCIVGADRCSMIIGAGVIFGACSGSHIVASRGASAFLSAPTTIAGNAGVAFLQCGANAIVLGGSTIAVTGTPSFGVALMYCVRNATLVLGATVFTGAATGKQYLVQTGAVIDGGGRGTSWLPSGMTAGTTDGTGLFI